MMETGEMRGRDSARARAVGTVADHRIILGSRKIGGIFISLGDTGSVIPHRDHMRLLPPLMLGFSHLHPLEMARDPSPAAGLLDSLPPCQALSSLVQGSMPWRGHRGRTPGPGHSPATLSAPAAEGGTPS